MKLKSNSKSRKQIILEESSILFQNMGYSATSMNDIADSLGIKASSLYNHIDSKQEILKDLLLNIAKKFFKGIVDVNESSYSAKDKLREIIRMHIRVATENQNITALILQDWKHLKEPALTEFLELRSSYREILKSVITKGMESGELKPKNPKIVLNIVLSSLRWIYDSEIYDDTRDVGLTELERTITEIVFEGVAGN